MFFTNRIPTHWNKLPRDIVTANSLNQFKNKVDTHFKGIMFTTNFAEYLKKKSKAIYKDRVIFQY